MVMNAGSELVGREAAVLAVRAALDRARNGRGGLLLASGEAGIGKSALARAAVRDAEGLGALVVLGAAWELGAAPTYFPLRPAFSALGIDPKTIAELANPFQAWELLLSGLARAASERWVLLVVEDVHAADVATLDLLTLLAQPLRSLSVLVVATARLQDPRVTDRVAQRLTRMARDGEHVALEPLAASAVRTLAERTIGRGVSDAALGELVTRTGGNPLFVVECAQALRASGTSASGLPSTVRQVVLDRVRLLPETTGEVLAAAAVIGRNFTAFIVAGVLERLPAQVIDALEPARRAGLVEESAPGRFTFTHILVRDAVEDALAPADRRTLHARASEALAKLDETLDVLVERARHALESWDATEAGVALGLRAGAELEKQGAFDRANALYQRIREARRGGLAPAASPDQRLHEARVARAAGRFSEARKLCLEVIELARKSGDGELFAEAALAFGAEIRPGVVERELVGLLEEAKERLPVPNGALGVRVLARLAAALQPAPDPAVPVALAREALASAHLLGDEGALIDVLFLAGAALVDFNPLAERVAVSEELARRALAKGELALAARGYGRLAVAQAELGEFAAFSEAVERMLAVSDELGAPRHRWRGLLLASMRALALGDVAASDRAVHEVRELEGVSDEPVLSLSLTAHAFSAAALLHRDEELLERTRALRLPPELPSAATMQVFLRAAAFARLEDRAATQAEFAGVRFETRSESEGFFEARVAEVYAFLEDVEACRRMRPAIAANPAPHIVSGHVPMTYEGPTLRVLGLLDSVLGDHASALTELENALATVTGAGLVPWMAQLEYDVGIALERAGRERDAALRFARARDRAAGVPMPGLVIRAERRRARITGESEAPAQPGPRPHERTPIVLTRDGEVWRLDFEGRRTLTLKHSRGIELLARLVERPGVEVHVLALASDEQGASLGDDGAGDLLDDQAKRAYRERLVELERELAEAESHHDRGRAANVEREREALMTELSRAVGLGGRGRRSGSPSERARVNVQRRLKDAITRIGEVDPDCGRFLSSRVQTGNYCVFLA